MKKLRLILLCFLMFLLVSCSITISTDTDDKNPGTNTLEVNIIDVGQGDAILIKTPLNKYVLIDSGSSKERDKFLNYLSSKKIDKINAVVITHPHEDHMGNMTEVLNQYTVENVYMPKVITTTKTFRTFMDKISEKSLKIKTVKAGVKFNLDGVDFDFLAPVNDSYDNMNNYSAVLKISYGDKSFLLTGDAEKISENEMIKNGNNLKADIIKIGHHGSTSSSSKKFLQTVSPDIAVISLGLNNDYGHPHKEIIELLNEMNLTIYRTDASGTITFNTDGQKIDIKVEK